MLAAKVIGIDILKKQIEKKRKKLSERRNVYAQGVTLIDRWIQKNFQQQGRLALKGRGWQPLSPVTELARRQGKKKSKGNQILIDTGTMKARWHLRHNASWGSVRSGVDYAAKHHYGEDVPKRPILPTQAQAWDAIEKLFTKWIRKIVK